MTSDTGARDLSKRGLIKKCPIDTKTAKNLMHRASLDLQTAARNLDQDPECTFTYSYTAMMRSGLALMLSQGFRPAMAKKHQTIVAFVENSLGTVLEDTAGSFDVLRRKRNQFIYEPDLPCSRKEAEEALKTARDFVDVLSQIINKERGQPELEFTQSKHKK